VEFLQQAGVINFTRTVATTVLNWSQTDWLNWVARYSFLNTNGSGGITTSSIADLSGRYQLYESITFTLGLTGSFVDVTGGKTSYYGGRADLSYSKKLPGDGRLLIGLNGAVQWYQQSFAEGTSFVSQEPLAFGKPFAQPLPLRYPFVILPTVVVTKISAGPLLPGCTPPPVPPLPLVEGRDYTLAPSGNSTLVVPVPCVGAVPGINPGDVVTVDYQYDTGSNYGYVMPQFHASISVDYGWIRPYYQHDQYDQDLTWGQGGQFLDRQRSDALGLELRFTGDIVQGGLTGEVRRFRSIQQSSYDGLRSSQNLSFSLSPLSIRLNASEDFQSFENPVRQTKGFSFGMGVNYGIAELAGGMFLYYDTLSPMLQIASASFRLHWNIRSLDIVPGLSFVSRVQGETAARDYMATIAVIRRF
jgi:hypothetical protein